MLRDQNQDQGAATVDVFEVLRVRFGSKFLAEKSMECVKAIKVGQNRDQ